MEKLNIAELLKDCPKGMELDCTMFDNVTLFRVDNRKDLIYSIKVLMGNKHITLTKYGQYTHEEFAKCIIFPKGKTTWEGFQRPFKDGDILATNNGKFIGIVKIENNKQQYGYVIINELNNLNINVPYGLGVNISYEFERFATEEEKQKLFDTIKANGYKWNTETKTLEKLIEPKFKVGDRIVKRNSINNSWIVSNISSEYYELKLPNGSEDIGVLLISEQNDWELVSVIPKFKIGDRITNGKVTITIGYIDDKYYYDIGRNNAYSLDINVQDDWKLAKFDISSLKPFDKVLVRDTNKQIWIADLFSNIVDEIYKFACVGHYSSQCIPYEDNEHLLGTTNNCDEYFKTW